MASKYDIDWTEFDDEDCDEITPYPGIADRSVAGDRFEPSAEKCPHCDDDGMVVVTSTIRRTWNGGMSEMKTRDSCHECNGIGFLNVDTSEERKRYYAEHGLTSDLVLLMRARSRNGEPLFQGCIRHEIRTERREMYFVNQGSADDPR